VDHLRVDALGGEGEAADQAGHHQAAAGERILLQAGQFGQVVHGGPPLLVLWRSIGGERGFAQRTT
jgi:hypothetical protein